jgi:hypothetical protein
MTCVAVSGMGTDNFSGKAMGRINLYIKEEDRGLF